MQPPVTKILSGLGRGKPLQYPIFPQINGPKKQSSSMKKPEKMRYQGQGRGRGGQISQENARVPSSTQDKTHINKSTNPTRNDRDSARDGDEIQHLQDKLSREESESSSSTSDDREHIYDTYEEYENNSNSTSLHTMEPEDEVAEIAQL